MNPPRLLASLLISGLTLATPGVWAHGDEDHSQPSAPASTVPAQTGAATSGTVNRPQRLPDGRVWLDKNSQQQLAIRTQISQWETLPRSMVLNGHVVMNPNAGGRVQAGQAGRISPGPAGLPLAGMPVKKGQLLAYLHPLVSAGERSSQQAELAELKVKAAQAARQLARLQALSATVAARELEAQRAELDALRQRASVLAAGGVTQALRAPASGVLAQANAINGQQFDAGAVLFEVLDPGQLLIEALVYDPATLDNLAYGSLPGSQTRWQVQGRTRAFRDGALPVLFKPQSASDIALALGQTVRLTVQTRTRWQGVPLPTASVVKNAANQSVVWVHESAELFRPYPVQLNPLDGQRVLVSGLPAQRRVVVAGAMLLNQIR